MRNSSKWQLTGGAAALVGVVLLGILAFGRGPGSGVNAQGTGTATGTFSVSAGGPYTGQTGVPITFVATPINAGSSTSDLVYTWNFGDGLSGSGQSLAHTYTTIGTFTVSLLAVGTSRQASTTTVATVSQGFPISAGGPYSGGVGQTITMTASAAGTVLPFDTIYTWNFGDGTPTVNSSISTVQHVYQLTGTFPVTLSIQSASTGRAGSATTTANIGLGLTLTIAGPSNPAVGISAVYTVSTTVAPPSDVVYSWNFGDGTATVTGQSASHNFAAAGSFTITVTASSSTTGFSGTGTLPVVVGGGTTTSTPTPTPTGPTVSLATGWSLVGGTTGTVYAGADGPLYTFQAGDTNYESLPNTTGITGGRGYWAYYFSPAVVSMNGSGTTTATIAAPASQWIMAGNPSSTTSVTVRGADAVDTWNGTAYAQGTVLGPGQGAWVISLNGGTITLGP